MPTIQLREDFDAAELRRLAKRSQNNRQIRRLLALAAVYDGMSRADAAQIGGMDRQTLRDWAHRFNAERRNGLTDRPRPGRECWLSEAQMALCFHIADAALGALKSNDQLESGLRVVKWIGFARTGMPRATDGDAS